MNNEKIGKYRWTICALVFFATTINYLDRAVISLLKSNLEVEFNWKESDYSNIVIAFQLSYALGMLFIGRLVDKAGSKIGYGISIFLWSLAAVGHALVKSTFGFMIARSALGISEAGNFPAAIKTVAEWFPRKERAFATGIFNAGTNVGAIAAPLSVPLIAEKWGWQWAFIITGAIGFIWIILWFWLYDSPSKSKRLKKPEYDYIHSDDSLEAEVIDKSAEAPTKEPWIKLLTYRHTWAYLVGKFLTDPVWWFYLFWLPAFLQAQYGLEGTAIALPVAVVYTLASFGSVLGGWLPLALIKKGWPLFRARRISMLIYAFMVIPVVFAQYLGSINIWLAVMIIGLAASAHQAWSANLYTTVSDRFVKRKVASVIGIGGMGGAIGGMLIAKLAGSLFDHYKALGSIEAGYYIMFIVCGSAYLVAWTLMKLIGGKSQVINL
ncbi:MAG: MFS transporter [Flavitalea sp.]